MEKVSIVIKTLDRSAVGSTNYLRETINNLERGRVFHSPHLGSIDIVDGGSPDFAAYMRRALPRPVDCQTHACTLQQNGQRCIAVGVEQAQRVGAEWVMVIEDDIDVCGRFLESTVAWLKDNADDGPNMYALGASYEQVKHFVAEGITYWAYPIHAFYGAQALVWRTEDAAHLAEWLGPDPSKDDERDCKHDLLLQDWGRSLGLEFFMATAPSLVQHIGKQSGIDNRFFTFSSWPGRDWVYNKEAQA